MERDTQLFKQVQHSASSVDQVEASVKQICVHGHVCVCMCVGHVCVCMCDRHSRIVGQFDPFSVMYLRKTGNKSSNNLICPAHKCQYLFAQIYNHSNY